MHKTPQRQVYNKRHHSAVETITQVLQTEGSKREVLSLFPDDLGRVYYSAIIIFCHGNSRLFDTRITCPVRIHFHALANFICVAHTEYEARIGGRKNLRHSISENTCSLM